MKGPQSGRYVEERKVSTETGNFEVKLKVFRSNNSHFVEKPRSFLLSINKNKSMDNFMHFPFWPNTVNFELDPVQFLEFKGILWVRSKVDGLGSKWTIKGGGVWTWRSRRLKVDGLESKWIVQKTMSGRSASWPRAGSRRSKRLEVNGSKGSKWTSQKAESGRSKMKKTGRS